LILPLDLSRDRLHRGRHPVSVADNGSSLQELQWFATRKSQLHC